jgi:hypothetical protein
MPKYIRKTLAAGDMLFSDAVPIDAMVDEQGIHVRKDAVTAYRPSPPVIYGQPLPSRPEPKFTTAEIDAMIESAKRRIADLRRTLANRKLS